MKPVETPPQVPKTATDAPSTTKVESPPQPVAAAALIAAGPTPDDVAGERLQRSIAINFNLK